MKNKKCPERKICPSYVGDACEGCAVGDEILKLHKRIDRLKKQNETLTIQMNAWALAAKRVSEDNQMNEETLNDLRKIAEFYHRELEKILSERENASKTDDVIVARKDSWIVTDADDGMCENYAGFVEFKCSECGAYFSIEDGQYDWYFGDPIPWKSCPMCGAKMVGERSERDEQKLL